MKVTNSNTVMMTKDKPEKKKSTNLSQAAKIARSAGGLIITPAKVECLATARSSVEVTNPSTVMMTRELSEKKKFTTQGQASVVTRPAEGRISIKAVARSSVEVTNPSTVF